MCLSVSDNDPYLPVKSEGRGGDDDHGVPFIFRLLLNGKSSYKIISDFCLISSLLDWKAHHPKLATHETQLLITDFFSFFFGGGGEDGC